MIANNADRAGVIHRVENASEAREFDLRVYTSSDNSAVRVRCNRETDAMTTIIIIIMLYNII